jgi:hypothetical protein
MLLLASCISSSASRHFVPGYSCCYISLHATSFFAALCGLLLFPLHNPWSYAVQVFRCAAAAAICTLAIVVVAATTTLAATDNYCFVSSGCRLLLFTVQVRTPGCSRLPSWIQAHFTSGGGLALHFASLLHCLQVTVCHVANIPSCTRACADNILSLRCYVQTLDALLMHVALGRREIRCQLHHFRCDPV